ncbi:protein often near L-alanine-DL-glutamate epimerase [Vibrio variabilis]|uniref:Protein often near L-alanine-DL-glutamate epimerase n=1 Tax=Vibrio variabilis TaxID=990271 RepID=A0ABQ0J7A0_9VIBR|nr:protein often near L-alanine-DL-glutamate epimerase [Vibrio variabilis]
MLSNVRDTMNIAQPYLLFLGDVTDPLAAKTARGIVQWRPQAC